VDEEAILLLRLARTLVQKGQTSVSSGEATLGELSEDWVEDPLPLLNKAFTLVEEEVRVTITKTWGAVAETEEVWSSL